PPVPHLLLPVCGSAGDRARAVRHGALLRSWRLLRRGRRHRADPHRHRPPVGARPSCRPAPRSRYRAGSAARPGRADGGHPGCKLMELVLAIGIGVLTTSGVWLILRPRTFQVIIGLSLLSYAVNLFIFSM